MYHWVFVPGDLANCYVTIISTKKTLLYFLSIAKLYKGEIINKK